MYANHPSAIFDDIAPDEFDVLHVQKREIIPGGLSRGGGLAMIFRESIAARCIALPLSATPDNVRGPTCRIRSIGAANYHHEHLQTSVVVDTHVPQRAHRPHHGCRCQRSRAANYVRRFKLFRHRQYTYP